MIWQTQDTGQTLVMIHNIVNSIVGDAVKLTIGAIALWRWLVKPIRDEIKEVRKEFNRRLGIGENHTVATVADGIGLRIDKVIEDGIKDKSYMLEKIGAADSSALKCNTSMNETESRIRSEFDDFKKERMRVDLRRENQIGYILGILRTELKADFDEENHGD